jgi:hypothetical protein
VVSVNVTVPAAYSAALGVYTAFIVVLLGEKIPVPPLQVPPVAEPPTAPARIIGEPTQAACGDPAFAVATASTVTTTTSVEVHPVAVVVVVTV